MKIFPLQSRWAACGLLLAATGALRLAAFAEEVVIKNPGSQPIPLVEAGPRMFTKADDVRITRGGILLFGEPGKQESCECNSLGIGADKTGPVSSLFVSNFDLFVARGISLGGIAAGSLQLYKNSSLKWEETLEVGAKGLLSVIFEKAQICGEAMILDGTLEIQFHSLDAIRNFVKAKRPVVELSGSLRISDAATVRIKLVSGAAGAPLPAGECFLISGKTTSGGLPQVEMEGGDSGPQISLKATPEGLFLAVNNQ